MKGGICFCMIVILIILCSNSYSLTGVPIKYISSCEMDLNNDQENDIALLIESSVEGRQLIILLKTKKDYKTIVLKRNIENMYLSCHFGKTIKETTAGSKEGKVLRTQGTYLELTQPEGSSIAYYWDVDHFKEVWTAD